MAMRVTLVIFDGFLEVKPTIGNVKPTIAISNNDSYRF